MKTLSALVMTAALSGCATHPVEYCRTVPAWYGLDEAAVHNLACAAMLLERPQKPFLVPSLEVAS